VYVWKGYHPSFSSFRRLLSWYNLTMRWKGRKYPFIVYNTYTCLEH